MADRERYALASQLAVLRACPEVISRLLKRGGSVLLAAKVLVISRLLHKKLSQRKNPAPYLEVLRNRLASLRWKLLTRIDRRLQSVESSAAALMEAMCAFSLATSSSSTDVLRHFLHVRQSAVLELGQRSNDEGIFNSLRLVIQTLRDCQQIFSVQLARSLEELKATSLLQSTDLQALQKLSLDIHQRWLGEDINSFIPYVRHDDLQKSDAARLLKQWAKQAFSSFLKALSAKLDGIGSPSVIVHLRQEMLQLWLSNQHHSLGADTSETLEGIRDIFVTRLQDLIHQHTSRLSNVASTIDTHLADWENGVSNACPSMWSDASTLTNNTKTLHETLSTRAYGRTEPVKSVAAKYQDWLEGIRDLESVIKTLRDKSWNDVLDTIDDDNAEDDEDDILENKQVLLSEDDPRILQETLQTDLQQSFQNLLEKMQSHSESLTRDHHDDRMEATYKATFLLRIWRQIITHLPPSYSGMQIQEDFTPVLRTLIADMVMETPLSRFAKATRKSSRCRERVLWEGDPPLPVLPSPRAFRLLHDVVRAMVAVVGADVWTVQGTGILKRRMREGVGEVVEGLAKGGSQEVEEEVNGHDVADDDDERDDGAGTASETGGDEESDKDINDEEKKGKENQTLTDGSDPLTSEPNGEDIKPQQQKPPSKEKYIRAITIQRLFDLLYLDNALTLPTPTNSDSEEKQDFVKQTQRSMAQDLGIQEGDVERMRQGARDYWGRTELLFALLK